MRTPVRYNLAAEHHAQLEANAQALGLSRSEVLNRALTKALASPLALIEALLSMPAETLSTAQPSTFTMEPNIVAEAEAIASRLQMSKDHFMKWVLIVYFRSK